MVLRMANRETIEKVVVSLTTLAAEQLRDANYVEAKDNLINALSIAVRNLKLTQDDVEPLVEVIHKLMKKHE